MGTSPSGKIPRLMKGISVGTLSYECPLKPFATSGHYVNDHVESGEDIVRAIYGAANTIGSLSFKREYDSDNAFGKNQNIKP